MEVNKNQQVETGMNDASNNGTEVSERRRPGKKPGNIEPVRTEQYCPSCGLSLLAYPDAELTCTKCNIPLVVFPKSKADFRRVMNKAYKRIGELEKLNALLLQEQAKVTGVTVEQ